MASSLHTRFGMKTRGLPPAQELLAMPAGEGARRVALALLDAVAEARPRLDDRSDAEALHDFRVSLRRLRSWIRAFEAELHGSIKKKHRLRLRTLSHEAGVARDAEVHVAWLRAVEEELRPRERPGAEWLLKRLTAQQHTAEASLRGTVAEMYDAGVSGLAKDLAVYTVRVDLRDPVPPATLRQAISPLILTQAAALADRLAGVQSIQDQAVAHAARIAGKRLRYLIEPISDAVQGGAALVKRLRVLQDTIGEMHDVHVMADQVIRAAEEAGAARGRLAATALLEGGENGAHPRREDDPRPGLLAIATKLRDRAHHTFSAMEQQWIGAHAADLTEAARALVSELANKTETTETTETTEARLSAAEGARPELVGVSARPVPAADGPGAAVQVEANGSAMLEQIDAADASSVSSVEAPIEPPVTPAFTAPPATQLEEQGDR